MLESPKTERGRATRERIVAAASELIGERGIAETSLDDVIEGCSRPSRRPSP